jgi:hypothetical protein
MNKINALLAMLVIFFEVAGNRVNDKPTNYATVGKKVPKIAY